MSFFSSGFLGDRWKALDSPRSGLPPGLLGEIGSRSHSSDVHVLGTTGRTWWEPLVPSPGKDLGIWSCLTSWGMVGHLLSVQAVRPPFPVLPELHLHPSRKGTPCVQTRHNYLKLLSMCHMEPLHPGVRWGIVETVLPGNGSLTGVPGRSVAAWCAKRPQWQRSGSSPGE